MFLTAFKLSSLRKKKTKKIYFFLKVLMASKRRERVARKGKRERERDREIKEGEKRNEREKKTIWLHIC